MNLALVLAELGETLLVVGSLDEASTLAVRLLEHARPHRAPGFQAYASRLLGEVARHRDPAAIEPAEGALRQALTLAEECGMRPHLARCHLSLGKLYRRTGRRDPSRAALVDAVELFREMDMIFWLPEAEAELAQVSDQSLT